jgi:Transport protein Avl9
MMQFTLVSLIPGLIRNLQDCADPSFHSYEMNLVKPTTLKTSERRSCTSTPD